MRFQSAGRDCEKRLAALGARALGSEVAYTWWAQRRRLLRNAGDQPPRPVPVVRGACPGGGRRPGSARAGHVGSGGVGVPARRAGVARRRASVLSRKYLEHRPTIRAGRCVAPRLHTFGYAPSSRLAAGPVCRPLCSSYFRDRTLAQMEKAPSRRGRKGPFFTICLSERDYGEMTGAVALLLQASLAAAPTPQPPRATLPGPWTFGAGVDVVASSFG